MKNNKSYNGFATHLERKIMLLIARYDIPFMFVGNCAVNFRGLCPDFIHKKYNIVIEVYHSIYKDKNYKRDRLEKLRRANFEDVLFLDETILEDENWESLCLSKIKDFTDKYDKIFEIGKLNRQKLKDRFRIFYDEELENMSYEDKCEGFYMFNSREDKYLLEDFKL